MTVTIHMPTVAEKIARLSVEGVTILDIDAITTQYTLAPYTLAPRPDDYATDFTIERLSFGTGGAQKMDLTYNLHYRYFHTALGNQLNFGSYSHMIDNIVNIMEALVTADSLTGSDGDPQGGAVDMQLAGVSGIGPVTDPAGNAYHGCDFTLAIREFIV